MMKFNDELAVIKIYEFLNVKALVVYLKREKYIISMELSYKPSIEIESPCEIVDLFVAFVVKISLKLCNRFCC